MRPDCRARCQVVVKTAVAGAMDTTESVMRRMTRLALEPNAVNLSQGSTAKPPVFDLVWAAVTAMLGGDDDQMDRPGTSPLRELVPGAEPTALLDRPLKEVLAGLQGSPDRLNQYSFPLSPLRVLSQSPDARGGRPPPVAPETGNLRPAAVQVG